MLPGESSDHLTRAGITFFPLDVTKEKSVVELKARVQKLTDGRLDVLVNCACVLPFPFPALSTTEYEAVASRTP